MGVGCEASRVEMLSGPTSFEIKASGFPVQGQSGGKRDKDLGCCGAGFGAGFVYRKVCVSSSMIRKL